MKPENEHGLPCCSDKPDGNMCSETIRTLMVVTHELDRAVGARVQHTGVFRSQHRLLMMLSRHPDLTQKDLAERHHISPASVTGSLQKLEQGGYIVRKNLAEDSRSKEILLTDKGTAVVQESLKIFGDVEQTALKGFDDAECEQLRKYMERMIRNIQKAGEKTP